ncbi:MAG: DUF6538 domain-containing protein [Mesorhizobium sp.]
MASKSQYLEWHGQQWRVRIKVPARLRTLLGRSKLTHPLHTADLKEANERKWAVVTKFKDMLAACEKAQSTADPIDGEALRLRLFKDEEGAQDHIVDRAYEIEEALGYPRAKAFADLALGRLTPLGDHADAFVADRDYRMKSAGDFRRALDGLGDWLKDAEHPLGWGLIQSHEITAATRATADR